MQQDCSSPRFAFPHAWKQNLCPFIHRARLSAALCPRAPCLCPGMGAPGYSSGLQWHQLLPQAVGAALRPECEATWKTFSPWSNPIPLLCSYLSSRAYLGSQQPPSVYTQLSMTRGGCLQSHQLLFLEGKWNQRHRWRQSSLKRGFVNMETSWDVIKI